jgi:RND family efflux transporter MFP subunit
MSLLLTATLTACHDAPPATASLPKAEVITVQGGCLVGTVDYPVRIEARYANDMAFRVAGKLLERDVHLGDAVRQGQVLARLDAVDAKLQLANAGAALDAAVHRLTFASQQLTRDQSQAALNLISKVQLEQSQDNAAAAKAARDQAADQLRILQNNLAYQVLRADHDGVITAEYADTGAVLSAGQPVYHLAWRGDKDAVMDVPASDIGRLQIGQLASIRLTALPGVKLSAKVREKAPEEDTQSGSFRVKLTLVNPDPAVLLGLSGEASLQPGSTSAADGRKRVVIPASALFHQGDKPAVWVLPPAGQGLVLRLVTISRFDDDAVTLSSGLAAGERIVAAGVHTVYAGERVLPIAPLFADPARDDASQGGVQ